jgi:hypothetical protein
MKIDNDRYELHIGQQYRLYWIDTEQNLIRPVSFIVDSKRAYQI